MIEINHLQIALVNVKPLYYALVSAITFCKRFLIKTKFKRLTLLVMSLTETRQSTSNANIERSSLNSIIDNKSMNPFAPRAQCKIVYVYVYR